MQKALLFKALASIFVVSIAFSLCLSIFELPIAKAEGEIPPGWLSGWTYRKKHIITGAACAGANYQMMFKVRRASGTDSGNVVYVSTKCKEDFSDVRFADADGNVFPYAITYMTTDEAWFWIKPHLDLSTDQTIYIYYGNPEATGESSIDQTFIFAEDWSNSTLQPRWELISGTYNIDTSLRRLHTASNNLKLKSRNTITFPSTYIVESFSAAQEEPSPLRIDGKIGDMWGTSAHCWRGGFSITSGEISSSNLGTVHISYHGYYYQKHKLKIAVGHNDYDAIYSYTYDVNAIRTEYFLISRNSSGYINVTCTSKSLNFTELNMESPDRIYLFTMLNTARELWVYGFKIRKFVDPEPGHGTWYEEEAVTQITARLTVNVEPVELSYIAFTLDYPQQILFAPWSNLLNTGSHTLTVLDEKVTVNSTYVYGFKCWKKGGEVVSFDKSYTFNLPAGTTEVTIVFAAHNVTIVSEPEIYVHLKVDDWEVQTPTNIYRGSGYYHFEALDTQLYHNATHMLKFYGWYVDNIYLGSDTALNLYISYKTQIKLAYKTVEIPTPPPMTFKASIVELGTIQAGSTKDFSVTVMFDANALTIQSVEFQTKSGWLQMVHTLPMHATRGLEALGTATIQARLTVPANVQGYYNIPFTVTATTPQNQNITTVSYITFTATTTPSTTETTITQGGFIETITRLLGNPILLLLLIALIAWLASYSLKKH
ncbi:hypothetical protein DRO69_07240 [Candidatus Bathyarchaeota archaeon]|nr:MAG: hypothetical protein DRO69_07240 [Candidatus Bathyarchaeota archaeon]